MDSEIWVDLKGYEGRYIISSIGRIKALKRKSITKKNWILPVRERIITQFFGNTGYINASVSKGGVKRRNIHRMMAESFLPNPDNKPQVNHKNGIKTDNRLENLEWCTNSENIRHADKMGLRKIASGEKHPLSKLILNTQTGIYYYTVREAAFSIGMHRDTLSDRLRGKVFNNTSFIVV